MARPLDMTQGNPGKLLIQFSIPLLLGSLLQQVYSITDSVIVGRVLGPTSLAAIGVCMPIVFLITSIAFGLNIGITVIFSQCVGEKNLEKMRAVYANSVMLAFLLAVVLTTIGVILTKPILYLIDTPDAVMKEAVEYLMIAFITTAFPIFYYLFANIAKGMGDSYTSLYCLIVSVISNIVLDFIFVVLLGTGVKGSAIATAMAQAMSVIFAYFALWRKFPTIRLKRSDFKINLQIFKQISAVAIPIAIQNAFNNLGNIVVQSCINGFGASVMAAYTAASRLNVFFLLPADTASNALSIYAGQNYGAKDDGRIRNGLKACLKIMLVVSIVIALIILCFGKFFVLLFLKETTPVIMSTSKVFLLFSTVPCILYAVMMIYQQTLRGIGKNNASVIGGFMQLGAKVVVSLLGAYIIKNTSIVWLAWPISYIAGTIYPMIVFAQYSKQNFDLK